MDEQKNNNQTENGQQLIDSAMAGNLDRAIACLKSDPGCVNAQDAATGVTALHVAIVMQDAQLVALLVAQPRCDPWIRDHMNRAAPDMLIYTRNRTIFDAVTAKAYPEAEKMWQELKP